MAKKQRSTVPSKINDGRTYHKNPRTITEGQFKFLKEALEEFGDLSGIVHDLRTNQFVGGNQRSRVFSLEEAEINIVTTYDPPTPVGTVCEGYILYNQEKYAYRGVYWTDERIERANLIANKAGGNWDFDMLANVYNVDTLLASGFTPQDLSMTAPPPLPIETMGIGAGIGIGPGKEEEEAEGDPISEEGDCYDFFIGMVPDSQTHPLEIDRIVKHFVTYCQSKGLRLNVLCNGEPLREEQRKHFYPAEVPAGAT